jgi:hypothetical protein
MAAKERKEHKNFRTEAFGGILPTALEATEARL